MNRILSLFSKGDGYFHDGSIHNIICNYDALTIYMESAVLLPEWSWNRIALPLSKRGTIAGKLQFKGISRLIVDGMPSQRLKMIYKYSEIFNFHIDEHKACFLVRWEEYTPKQKETKLINIEIEAALIHWENIPHLFDQFWDAEYRKSSS